MTLHRSLFEPSASATVVACSATLLPDGKAILVVQGDGPMVPSAGQLTCAAGALDWAADVAAREDVRGGWSGLAVIPTLPTGDCILFDVSGQQMWRLGAGQQIGASARFLVASAQTTGIAVGRVLGLLATLLDDAARSAAPEMRALRNFVREFLETVAERDGFIEVMAEPLTGGLYMQGWAQSLADGPLSWISLDALLSRPDVTAAFFQRPDLLAPARGLCLYGLGVSAADLSEGRSAFLSQGNRILRLDLVASAPPLLRGDAATLHVAEMLPRLQARPVALSAFRRICRPRYAGEDTLSGTGLPVALGIDTVQRAPDGTLLVIGWLLDPDRRVAMALVKSRGNRYGRISDDWVRLPRPDLFAAFHVDPRFAGRLDAADNLHGFIAVVPPAPQQAMDPEVYVELVLDDEGCLFLPIRPVDVSGTARLATVLAALSPTEPQLARIIDAQLVPFVVALQPAKDFRPIPPQVAPIPLGRIDLGRPSRPRIPALLPLTSLDDLQPVLALLAGTDAAEALDLHLIAGRAVAEATLPDLESAFRFYGLLGHLVLASGRTSQAVCLDAALAGLDDTSDLILFWGPAALPQSPDWLATLCAEVRSIRVASGPFGALSPALVHEDGSVAFGTSPGTGSILGYSRSALHRGAPVRVSSPAPDIALIDRAALISAGGFAGQLLSGAHAHLDLGARLADAGYPVWCSGGVEFWRLDARPATAPSPADQILKRIDARLLAYRGVPDPEEYLA